MAFLDELKKGISDVSGQIAKKSGEIVEIQKLKIKKSGLESDIKKCYSQIGQIFFLKMEESGAIDEDVEDFFQQIVEAKAAIEEIQEKINVLSSDTVCAVCGEHISKTAMFCSHCGSKIERPVEPEVEETCEDDDAVVEEAVEVAEEACECAEEACECAEEACECAEEACECAEEACECAEEACECAEEACECAEEAKEEPEEKPCCCCGSEE